MEDLVKVAKDVVAFVEQNVTNAKPYEEYTKSEFEAIGKNLGEIMEKLEKALAANTDPAAELYARELINKSADDLLKASNGWEE